jgi:hypothetical protein
MEIRRTAKSPSDFFLGANKLLYASYFIAQSVTALSIFPPAEMGNSKFIDAII